LLRAYLGFAGRGFMVSPSVRVRMILFSLSPSMNGAMSARVPQRALPYSMSVDFCQGLRGL
jgi:hypothetical protein